MVCPRHPTPKRTVRKEKTVVEKGWRERGLRERACGWPHLTNFTRVNQVELPVFWKEFAHMSPHRPQPPRAEAQG